MAVAARTENHIHAFIGYDKSESHEGLFWCVQEALSTVNDQSEGSMVPIAQINAASAAHASGAHAVTICHQRAVEKD